MAMTEAVRREAAMTSVALRIYTVVIGVVCAVAIVFSLRAQSMAAGWQTDSRAWQSLVRTTALRDRAVTRAEHRLAVQYNRLVRRTTRSQRKLIVALHRAQSATVTAPQATVYSPASAPSPVSSAAAPAPAPVPVAAPAPAPVPTTHTS
jgi:hypothetical protein